MSAGDDIWGEPSTEDVHLGQTPDPFGSAPVAPVAPVPPVCKEGVNQTGAPSAAADIWGSPSTDEEPSREGADTLDDVEAFLARFIVYPSEHARIAHVLWIAHTWFMGAWESTPRIAFLSPEPSSGKSRALEVTEPLVPRPVHAVNTTPAYLFRKVSDPEGAPTILYDEIDTVFGPKAKDNEDIRGMLNAGHRRGATAGRCVVKGRVVETEELPAYCAVALAGLNDLPDTIMSRSVVIRMRRRAAGESVQPWRLRINRPEAEELRDALRAWSVEAVHKIAWPDIPVGIADRNADVWEALLAVADLAGFAWPERARVAAVALVADSMAGAPSIGVLLLADLRTLFAGRDKLPTEAILTALHELDESPWGDLRGKPVDSRWLSRQLGKYGVQAKDIRYEGKVVRGYDAADLADPWGRYVADTEDPFRELRERSTTQSKAAVGAPAIESATSATAATEPGSEREKPDEPDESLAVADGQHRCNLCGQAAVPRRGGMCMPCYQGMSSTALAQLAAKENRP